MFSGILQRLGNDIEIMSRTTDVIMSTDGWKNGVGRKVLHLRGSGNHFGDKGSVSRMMTECEIERGQHSLKR